MKPEKVMELKTDIKKLASDMLAWANGLSMMLEDDVEDYISARTVSISMSSTAFHIREICNELILAQQENRK